MAGLDNSLDLGAAAELLGVKGPIGTLPIVPGVFPTLSLHDLSALSANPRRSICLASTTWALPALRSDMVYLRSPTPIIVRYVFYESTDPAQPWQLAASRSASGGAPSGAEIDLGELAHRTSFILRTQAPFGGARLPSGSARVDLPPDVRLEAGNSLCLISGVSPAGGATLLAGIFWEECPVSSIQP